MSCSPLHRVPVRLHLERTGVTLLELLVALALLGAMAALVAPSLTPPPRRDQRLDGVLRAAREAAIGRAQTLSLSIARSGDWALRPLPPDDSLLVIGGLIDAPPSAPMQLQLSPLGACLPTSPLPVEFTDWDLASCSAVRSPPVSE